MNNLYPNLKIHFSPVGPGIITEITQAGYYKVNGIAVAWLMAYDIKLKDYYLFDPNDLMSKGKINVCLLKNFDPEKDIPRPLNCVIVSSAEHYNRIKRDIPNLSMIKEVLIK